MPPENTISPRATASPTRRPTAWPFPTTSSRPAARWRGCCRRWPTPAEMMKSTATADRPRTRRTNRPHRAVRDGRTGGQRPQPRLRGQRLRDGRPARRLWHAAGVRGRGARRAPAGAPGADLRHRGERPTGRGSRRRRHDRRGRRRRLWHRAGRTGRQRHGDADGHANRQRRRQRPRVPGRLLRLEPGRRLCRRRRSGRRSGSRPAQRPAGHSRLTVTHHHHALRARARLPAGPAAARRDT